MNLFLVKYNQYFLSHTRSSIYFRDCSVFCLFVRFFVCSILLDTKKIFLFGLLKLCQSFHLQTVMDIIIVL